MVTIIDRIFRKRPRADEQVKDCAGLYYPLERTGLEPAEQPAPPRHFPKLKLNRETVEILKDDKIATGG